MMTNTPRTFVGTTTFQVQRHDLRPLRARDHPGDRPRPRCPQRRRRPPGRGRHRLVDPAVDRADIAAAVDEAGYVLVP